MKQTAIQISMINNINTRNKHDEQRMTSLEIAQLTGKRHCDTIRAIRNMEPAWEKVNGSRFGLVDYRDAKGELRPCYSLTKTETLYIATKFNDEARARLVLRWEELEIAHRGSSCVPSVASGGAERLCAQSPCALLGSDEAVLNEADAIIGDELDKLNRNSDYCYSPTDIGKPFGLDGRDLNSFLADQGIIQWANGQWNLTDKYKGQGLTENRSFCYHGRDGRRKYQSRLVWTEEGRQFILDILRN